MWNSFNSIVHENCRGSIYENCGIIVHIMEEGQILNPEQLAYCSNFIKARRLNRLADKHAFSMMLQREYPAWLDYVERNTNPDICERYTHIGPSYADAESGYDDFHCIFCDFEQFGYMS